MSRFTTGLAELVLIVEDVPRAADFYRNVVGLDLQSLADDATSYYFYDPDRNLLELWSPDES
jgi:catechol 2,3-dioxygenase-like lactoylglutathione lyase family enzyme